MVGISHEWEEAPGIVITMASSYVDYAPDHGEFGQIPLFEFVPERLEACSIAVVPPLVYARQRPDWTEARTEWITDNVSGAVAALLLKSTPTVVAEPVE